MWSYSSAISLVFFSIILLLGIFLTSFTASVRADDKYPWSNPNDSISISAEAANRWTSGSYDIYILRGNCILQQGTNRTRSREAVVWVDRANGKDKTENKVIVYLEGDVLLERRGAAGSTKPADQTWLGRFYTNREIQPRVGQTVGQPDVMPPIYQRGMDRRRPISSDTLTRTEVLPAQFVQPSDTLVPVGPLPGSSGAPGSAVLPGPSTIPGFSTMPGATNPPGLAEPIPTPPPLIGRRIRVFPRGDMGFQVQSMPDPGDPNGNRRVTYINSGVNVLVDGINMNVSGLGNIDSIDVSADRAVIWTVQQESTNVTAKEGINQDPKLPLELYLEGNIVFRQGDRVIHADRMYYDVPNNVGTVLNAEMLTPFKDYPGKIRIKSDLIQQTGEGQFFARDSFLTSSRMGSPGYRLQSGDIYFEDIQRPAIDPITHQPALDQNTGEPLLDHEQSVTAANNFLFLGPVPVFYYPYMRTDLKEPTFYIRRARAKYDNVYGAQILTNWDAYQLLGIKNKPKGTDWDFSVDYLGKRGWGGGTNFTYGFDDEFFGFPEHTGGMVDFWGIHDNGLDNLGIGRSALKPEKINRFRLFGQHRQIMPGGYQLSAEVGWISDRNFLESFYKREWDELKDQSTDLEFKRLYENTSWSIMAGVQLNKFFTQTEWLPRGDHYWLGQPLLNDTLTWYEHTNIAYARFRPATAPANPNDQPFAYLPWQVSPPFATSQNPASAVGQRLATRQEIDYPFQLGAVKIVPYALGEAANWGQDLEGKGLTRLYGQGGVRANLPIWSVDPNIQDDLFNIHGIMHKVNFTAEYAYSKSNKDLTLLPLYDPLDDDSIEAGRMRNRVGDFNSPPNPFPMKYDERFYAIRSGLGSSVTSPSTEVLGDLSVFRLGAEQRWQTKRGAPGNEHIVDWITFDTGLNLYTNPDRDNFGTVPGLANYDFRWHVGDRLTMVSNGIFDFWSGGESIYTVGAFLTRPPRGSLYLGYSFINGPIQNRVVSVSYSYWMSPKWITSFGTSIDLGKQGNIGEFFSITRVGESLLINLGFTVDPSRNSTGVMFTIEPRFVPKNSLSNVNGTVIPPAGARGLE